MNSLQSRLVLGGAGVFATGFFIAGIAVYGFSRSTMYGEFDETLRATVQALAALTEETHEGVHFEVTEEFEEFTRKDNPSYYQVWLDGKVLARSPHLSRGDLVFGYGSFLQPDYTTIRLPDGRIGRQASITFQPKAHFDDDDDDVYDDDDGLRSDRPHFWATTGSSPDFDPGTKRWQDSAASVTPLANRSELESVTNMESDAAPVPIKPTESGILTLTWERPERQVTITVARETTAIQQQLASLRWILAIVGFGITALSCCMLVLVVRRGLRPVESVTRAITAIDENSLNSRVPTAQVPTEIAPMVRRLNDLLERLEDAFHRERAFSSNLAHELRTPLAGLRSTLEVYLSRLHQPEEYQEAMESCLQICDQSQNLVENLLSLARVEGQTLGRHYEPVDVADVFRECWRPLSEDAATKHLHTEFELHPHVIHTDREMLRVILRNVLSNSVSYSDHGGTIEATITDSGDTVAIHVNNTGHHLTQDQADDVFDRLWRGDQGRGQTGEHFGLGLTLTKRFVETLGGTVGVTIDHMFRLSLSLPVVAGLAD